jgi:hypothetical protein
VDKFIARVEAEIGGEKTDKPLKNRYGKVKCRRYNRSAWIYHAQRNERQA